MGNDEYYFDFASANDDWSNFIRERLKQARQPKEEYPQQDKEYYYSNDKILVRNKIDEDWKEVFVIPIPNPFAYVLRIPYREESGHEKFVKWLCTGIKS